MSEADPGSGGLPAGALVAGASVTYVALSVFGLGMGSLITDTDVIAVPGLGPLPGIIAMAVSVAVFAVTLLPVIRAPHPSYVPAAWVALGTVAAHALALWLAASGTDGVRAAAAVGQVLIGWVAPLLLLIAFASAWGWIAVKRTAAKPPRWPWEEDEQE